MIVEKTHSFECQEVMLIATVTANHSLRKTLAIPSNRSGFEKSQHSEMLLHFCAKSQRKSIRILFYFLLNCIAVEQTTAITFTK